MKYKLLFFVLYSNNLLINQSIKIFYVYTQSNLQLNARLVEYDTNLKMMMMISLPVLKGNRRSVQSSVELGDIYILVIND